MGWKKKSDMQMVILFETKWYIRNTFEEPHDIIGCVPFYKHVSVNTYS